MSEKAAAKDTEKPAAKEAEQPAIVDANSAAVEAYRHPLDPRPEAAPQQPADVQPGVVQSTEPAAPSVPRKAK